MFSFTPRLFYLLEKKFATHWIGAHAQQYEVLTASLNNQQVKKEGNYRGTCVTSEKPK
jgi:hypothetical protein